MDIAAPIFAGLGLFFIGIRLISANLKQLAGRKMRVMIAKALSGHGSIAVFGLSAGAIMQSVNAVTFVLVALVSAGAVQTRRAFPVINWANLGTSMIVLVAAINMHLMVLVLVGLTGFAYYLHLDQSARYRHVVGALLGVGLLFLGIDFIKSGTAPLKQLETLRVYLELSSHYYVLSFAMGTGVALIAQSSTTVSVLTMAMAAGGLITFESGALIVLGAGLGSGLSARMLAGKLSGSARQLVSYQVILKGLGVAVTVLLFAVEWSTGWPMLTAAIRALGLSTSAQLAAVYVVLQIVSDLSVRLLNGPIIRHVERTAPPSVEEVLGKPHYLNDHALDEPESALMLVDLEQQRLLATLPGYLDTLRADVQQPGPAPAVRHAAEREVLKQCEHFITELADRNRSRTVLDRTIVLRDRTELLLAMQETLAELNTAVAGGGSKAGEVNRLTGNLVEGLHMMLQTLADAAASAHPDDLALLRALTHDRSELMDGIRRRLLRDNADLSPHAQQAAFAATALFERAVWLMRRYVLLLDAADTAASDVHP